MFLGGTMKVITFVKTDGACDYYRCIAPTEAMLRNEPEVKLLPLSIGEPLGKLIEGLQADIFFMPRALGEFDEELIKSLKANGKKFVTDFDDNLFDVSPFSNHYEEYGTKNIQIKDEKGTVQNLWKDGETYNFSIKRNQKRLDSLKRCLELADAVFTTTQPLADVYTQYTNKLYVAPNSVDLNEWKPVEYKRQDTDEVRLYWSGGSSHFEDVILIKEPLAHIMAKYKNVKLIIMGMHFRAMTSGLPQERFEWYDWVHTRAYPYKTNLLDVDISMIPLASTRFNECKSNIKWVEQGSLLTPSVTSLVSPYKEHYNGVNGVFVENNSEEGWIDGISYLIENPIDRWKMGAEARKTVENKFNIDKNYKIWYDAFKEIIDGN
jgi:glycosyltransferase involved in cell wall biosynthesis